MGLALPIVNSDHSPIVLIPNPPTRCARYFKYESYWEENENCREVVDEGWKYNLGNVDAWQHLDSKMKNFKRSLGAWNQKTFKNAAAEITKLKKKLEILLNAKPMDGEEVKRIRHEIDFYWKQEEMYWGQRSRLKWLTFGDKNSTFFHITIVQRRDRNRLSRIKNMEGEWVEGNKDVMLAIEEFYKDLYSTSNPENSCNCLQVIPNGVTQDMNDSLIDPVTMKEVKQAVFNLGVNKAPGPDGLNGVFFQKNWEIIQNDVLLVVSSFFQSGELGDFVNETVVALIPKVPDPESIRWPRPISCCNYIYKIISKIIVHRLKPFLNALISPQQSAFVGDRLIQDNLMVAQEAFHFLK